MTQRIALVTGGGRGLGKNAALKLANKGIGIVLTWNSNEKEAQQVVDEIRQSGGKAAALPLNVGDISTFPSFVEQMKGPFFLTQSLLPLMNKGGRILNVSTGLARFALPGYSAYAAMKGAMEVLTRYQAKELGERGITANIIAPGAIETDFGGGNVRDNAQLNAYIASQTALGRVGLPDDIGDAIAALLSDELAWMTAQRIEVSGGMFL